MFLITSRPASGSFQAQRIGWKCIMYFETTRCPAWLARIWGDLGRVAVRWPVAVKGFGCRKRGCIASCNRTMMTQNDY